MSTGNTVTRPDNMFRNFPSLVDIGLFMKISAEYLGSVKSVNLCFEINGFFETIQ